MPPHAIHRKPQMVVFDQKRHIFSDIVPIRELRETTDGAICGAKAAAVAAVCSLFRER